jgi:hypothetical protein
VEGVEGQLHADHQTSRRGVEHGKRVSLSESTAALAGLCLRGEDHATKRRDDIDVVDRRPGHERSVAGVELLAVPLCERLPDRDGLIGRGWIEHDEERTRRHGVPADDDQDARPGAHVRGS